LAMGSFEWMEVETLSSEIAGLETRLNAARSRHNYGLVKVLKEEIAAAQQRRARYLANISNSLAASLDKGAKPGAAEAAEVPAPRGGRKEERPAVADAERATGKAAAAAPDPVVPEPAGEEAETAVAEPVEAVAEPVEAVAEPVDAAAEVVDAAAEPEPEPEPRVEAEEPPVGEAEAAAAEPEGALPSEEELAAEASPDVAEPVSEAVSDAADVAGGTEPPSEQPEEGAPEEVQEAAAKPARKGAEPAEDIMPNRAAAAAADAIRGVFAVWEQLSPSDIDRAKRELDVRRADMLARHAEELKALEADQVEIDKLAQAIDAFVRKFNLPTEGSVVRLDEKRAS
jgi:hypothetical protein